MMGVPTYAMSRDLVVSNVMIRSGVNSNAAQTTINDPYGDSVRTPATYDAPTTRHVHTSQRRRFGFMIGSGLSSRETW